MKKTILFVDDEPNVIQGFKRMFYNTKDKWTLLFATGGEQALEIFKTHQVDVIVSDMRMPCMDGAELLNRVMNLYPHVIRIILSGHSDQDMILRTVAAAHQFLAKPCSPEALKETIERAFLLRTLLNKDEIRNIIIGIKNLPSLPTLYSEIIKEMQSPNASLNKIGDIISRDVTMTAKILKIVNSAFFGLPHKIINPKQAVVLLGIDILKALILYVQIFSSFGNRYSAFSKALWNHSLSVANLAKEIACGEKADPKTVDQSYVAGLLHDIGKLVLIELPEFAELKGNYSSLVNEYRLIGTTHAEIGAYLLGLWGFSDSIVEAIAYHHRPSEYKDNHFTPFKAVYVANLLINQHKVNSKETAYSDLVCIL